MQGLDIAWATEVSTCQATSRTAFGEPPLRNIARDDSRGNWKAGADRPRFFRCMMSKHLQIGTFEDEDIVRADESTCEVLFRQCAA